MKIITKKLSSLCKVFLDEEPRGEYYHGETFQNECFSFQLGYKICEDITLVDAYMNIEVSPSEAVSVFTVGNVPSTLPCYPDADDDYLRRSPCMIPDVLEPMNGKIRLTCPHWHSLWFEVDCKRLTLGEQNISICITLSDGTVVNENFAFTVMKGYLPEQRLICTQWIHYD
ncbi:MAG: hypothetical protein RR087_01115, partial [Oscillospiraceae bacterium]